MTLKELIDKSRCSSDYLNYSGGVGKIGYHQNDVIYVYQWNNAGGFGGMSCWSESGDRPYHYDNETTDEFVILNRVIKLLKPEATEQEIEELNKACDEFSDSEYDYYRNSDDFFVKYIPLDNVCKILNVILEDGI